ncbi:MAG: septum formation initiator family protein [Desulfobacterales bacterium]|nr:septum formation initiator family protein [Desulfobacterales bacterium]MBS3755681.1 septum formation initiator family protein [Desulfobacterales bacterium]
MKEGFNKTRLLDIGLWTASLMMGVYLLIIIFGGHGLMALKSMRRDLDSVKQQNARVEQQNTEMYRAINRLKNDPEYIEYMARHELNMVAPGEIVFKFSDQSEAPENE